MLNVNYNYPIYKKYIGGFTDQDATDAELIVKFTGITSGTPIIAHGINGIDESDDDSWIEHDNKEIWEDYYPDDGTGDPIKTFFEVINEN